MKKVVTTSIVLLSTLALTACSTNNINKKISKDKATTIALKDAKLNKKDVSNLQIKSDKEDGKATYEIDFDTNKKEYDYTVNAQTGKIIKKSTDAKGLSGAKDLTKESISQDKAKSIALEDANVKEKNTSMMSIKKDMEDATSTYDVKFTANNVEYDYTINAKTGEIIEKSSDN
ncbi:PepSY domain-containing protein [Streptococcus porcinus]|uniref:PepSY domain-containing protein n=1 Tax=Streptococcus porcinus TaxID=1340 RepID=A0A7V9WRE9_STRPO|nr:PepSY domain-containing protein [Streptococcus porcinus]MBA2795712.1 PepSY domain-containing protein [Streptococcus porcinus]